MSVRDILDQLRDPKCKFSREQAADEIERLRAELAAEREMVAELKEWRKVVGDQLLAEIRNSTNLQAERDALRAALERIADADPDDGTGYVHAVANAALKEGGGDDLLKRLRLKMVVTDAQGRDCAGARNQDGDEAADRIERMSAELAAAKERASKYQRIAAELTDTLNGTPCTEIRWQQERDELRGLLREARDIIPRDWAFWSRIDAALKGDIGG